ncbi:MAG: hypothetical protein P1U34_10505 [Coxiellaceae bacterium]|nr:hypothetical protein [Coxiellaceae bacterium]
MPKRPVPRPEPKGSRYNLRARKNGKVVKEPDETHTAADRAAAAVLVAMRKQWLQSAPVGDTHEASTATEYSVIYRRGG